MLLLPLPRFSLAAPKLCPPRAARQLVSVTVFNASLLLPSFSPRLKAHQSRALAHGPFWAPEAEQTARGFPGHAATGGNNLICPHPEQLSLGL